MFASGETMASDTANDECADIPPTDWLRPKDGESGS